MMKTLVATFWALGLMASVAASDAAEGRRVVLHARIELSEATSDRTLGAQSNLEASLHLRTPMMLYGHGPQAQFGYTDPVAETTVQGSAWGSGAMSFNTDDGNWQETFSMRTRWDRPVVPAQPTSVGVVPPEPALFGDGLDVQITLQLELQGSTARTMTAKGQTLSDHDTLPGRPIACNGNDGRTTVCKLDLALSPPLTKPRNPLTQEVFDGLVAGQAVPGVVDLLGLEGKAWTLVTEHLPTGHVVSRLQAEYQAPVKDGTSTWTRKLSVVLWSAIVGDESVPPGLGSLREPP